MRERKRKRGEIAVCRGALCFNKEGGWYVQEGKCAELGCTEKPFKVEGRI